MALDLLATSTTLGCYGGKTARVARAAAAQRSRLQRWRQCCRQFPFSRSTSVVRRMAISSAGTPASSSTSTMMFAPGACTSSSRAKPFSMSSSTCSPPSRSSSMVVPLSSSCRAFNVVVVVSDVQYRQLPIQRVTSNSQIDLCKIKYLNIKRVNKRR